MIDKIKRMLDSGEEVSLRYLGGIPRDGHASSYDRYLRDIKIVTVDAFENGYFNIKNSWYVIHIDNLKYFQIEKKEQDMSYSEKLINKDAKFQEMLSVASNAVDKGVLSCFTVNDMDYSDMIGKGLYLGLNMTYHAIENEIKGIEKMLDENNSVEQEVKELTFDDLIDVAVQAHKDGLLRSITIENCSILITKNDYGKRYYKKGFDSYSEAINWVNSLYTEIFAIESMEDIDNIKWDTAKAVLANECELDLNILDGAVNRSIMLRLLKGATVTQQKGNNNTAFNLEAFKNQAYTAMTKNLDQDIARFNEGK